jgi:cytochrome c oxidase assembly protein subunit 15
VKAAVAGERRSGFPFVYFMSETSDNSWLRRYACLTALATFILLGIGGTVTSKGVGMSVPDWPNSYGYNMFLFPASNWVGGIFDEHIHRLAATFVGVLVVGLTRWLGGRRSRLPLAIVGLGEMLAGAYFLLIGGDWKGTGFFLTGIAGVVLLAAAIWARNAPAARPLPVLGWIAFGLVQLQGLLGGLRVVLLKDQIGIFHATLAQLFFVLLSVTALMTTRWWRRLAEAESRRDGASPFDLETLETVNLAAVRSTTSLKRGVNESGSRRLDLLWWMVTSLTVLILVQLILGATMRHQHAGLAIPDFPLAYGKIWPAMDASSVELYNQKRIEATVVNPITAVQIALQMVHRIMAVLILAGVGIVAWLTRRNLGSKNPLSNMTLGWLGLILAQAILGAATIWSGKAADVATAHVLLGALSLASGTMISLVSVRQWRTAAVSKTSRSESKWLGRETHAAPSEESASCGWSSTQPRSVVQ